MNDHQMDNCAQIVSEQDISCPTPVCQPSGSAACANRDTPVVGEDAREEAIRQAGLAMQNSYWTYEQTGDFGALGEAHRHRLHMTELIRGRSPEYVAQLEAKRGLA